jgi:hypothetical protein
MPTEVREMLEAASPTAAKRLIQALDAERAIIVGHGDSSSVEMVPDFDLRLKAATALLDRLYGKPAQAITGDEGKPLRIGVVVLPPETD